MCNCGNKRSQLVDTYSRSSGAARMGMFGKNEPGVSFEYTGATALSVMGSISGKRYRFAHPGNIIMVDHRDVQGMRMIPKVREIS